MKIDKILSSLIEETDSKIAMIVLDGLGDLPTDGQGTPLEEANTPNMDALACESDLGLTIPLARGITPGSAPAHFALFGYNPFEYNIGRGFLSALGLGVKLKEGDLCVRLNLCTLEGDKVLDRRAGRISTSENQRLIDILRNKITIENLFEDDNERLLTAIKSPLMDKKQEVLFFTEKEHRAVMVLRGGNFSDKLTDSDPQKEGLDVLEIEGVDKDSKFTAKILNNINEQIKEVLVNEKVANGVIMRGYSMYQVLPSFNEKYKLNALGLASYPMYIGLSKLIGMKAIEEIEDEDQTVEALRRNLNSYNFFFMHFKKPDSYGEDGNFEKKKGIIEKIDRCIGEIKEMNIDTLIICGDHSTPAKMAAHSFHPVPFLINSKLSRSSANTNGFSEKECLKGDLGQFKAQEIMQLALAYSGKLKKYGA